MKKLRMMLSIVLLSVLSTSSFAQGGGGKCYDESTHLINLGVGTGGFATYHSTYRRSRGGGYDKGATPVFSLSYEQPLKNKVGPGYIGVGAYFSFQNAHSTYIYDYPYNGMQRYKNTENWNNTVIAGRGAYHWDGLNSAKAEVYAGTIIGVRISTYNYTTNNADPHYVYNEDQSVSATPAFSVFAGARYYFAPNVAVFGEVGAGVSFVSGGLTFKF